MCVCASVCVLLLVPVSAYVYARVCVCLFADALVPASLYLSLRVNVRRYLCGSVSVLVSVAE